MPDTRVKWFGLPFHEGSVAYSVSGLDAKGDTIATAEGRLSSAIDGPIEAAVNVVSRCRGNYVLLFANEARGVVAEIGRVHQHLGRELAVVTAFPAEAGSSGVATPVVNLPEATAGADVSADLPALDASVAGEATDADLAGWAASGGHDGLTMQTRRVDENGDLVEFDDGLGLRDVVPLADTAGMGPAAGTRATAFTDWVRQVAERFRRADEGEPPDLSDLLLLGGAAGYSQSLDAGRARCADTATMGPSRCQTGERCPLYGYCPDRPPAVRPGAAAGGPDFVLDLHTGALADLTPEQWSWLLEAEGIDVQVPLHFVVHGLDSRAEGPAGEINAACPPDDGTLVIAVNWDAGDSFVNFTSARDRADGWVGDTFGALLSGVHLANPLAELHFTGHSLGAKVVVEALSAWDDWRENNSGMGITPYVDVALIQAAISTNDVDVWVLRRLLVDRLTITVDPDDPNLAWMERISDEALGDEVASGDTNTLADIVADRHRLGLDTVVIAHHDGHLGLSPDLPVVGPVIDDQMNHGLGG